MWPAFTPTFLCRAIFRGYAEIFIFRRYIHLWGIEPRTYSYPGRSGNQYSVSWVKINLVAIRHYIQVR